MKKKTVRSLVSSGLCIGLVEILLCTTAFPVAAGDLAQTEKEAVQIESSAKKVVSDTYKDPKKGTLNWREAMVSGNGENGVMESCHPVNDTFIFQNTKFNMPTDDYRETKDLSGELEDARQAVMNNEQWQSEEQPDLDYDYTLHPGHQLRINMDDLLESEVKDYKRWTDYETAEIGVQFTVNGETWTRTTFTSREDNVTITYLKSSDKGSKINTTLSVDNLSDMAIDQEKEIDPGLSYKKIVEEQGEYLGIVGHYPVYPQSELKEGGFAGITRVINIGGSKERIELGSVDDALLAGENKNYGIRIQEAESLILITKSDRDKKMGTIDEFSGQGEYAVVSGLVDETRKVAEKKAYLTGNVFDYEKALAPHKKLHNEEFNKVAFQLSGDEADDSLTNEDLISKQRNSSTLNHAMLERAFYAGRYAQICASGYSTSRLSGLWMGAWNGYWQADYTTDANVNLQISGVNIGNMQHTSEGYINFLLRILPDFETNAARIYGMRDALMASPRTDGDRGNLVHFNKDYPFNYWNAGASWLLLPVYEYWQCFGNQQIPIGEDIDLSTLRSVLSVTDEDMTDEEINIIRERGYFNLEEDLLLPLLTKQANFWEQIVDPRYYVGTDGYKHYDNNKTSLESGERYLILPGYSPENTPSNTWIAITANSTMDIAAARSGLDMTIAMEKAVQRSGYEEAVLKWEMLKEQLPAYMYEEDGCLKEWALKDYWEQNNHRHVSHVYGIWPAHDTENEKLADGVQKALERRKEYNTGDDNASHGWLHQGLTEARLKSGKGVEESLRPLFTGSKLYYTSMMTNHDRNRDSAYCTDALITIPAIILEALSYSDTGKIQLLPALPEDWKQGNISGIMSRSRAEIENLEWDMETGEVTASISSEVEQSIDISCNMNCNSAEIVAGTGEILKDEAVIRLDLKQGETAKVRFLQGAVKEGTYKITSEEGTLDLKTGQENSSVMLKADALNDISQKWNLINCGIGQFKIKNAETGKSLTVADSNIVQTMQGDTWSLEETEQGYLLLNKDRTLAIGKSNAQLILTEQEAAIVFTLEAQETVEPPTVTGGIEITGDSPLYSGDSVQLKASVKTPDGSREDMDMVWSVRNKDGEATITEQGILTAEKSGTVTVQVYPKEVPVSVEEKEIVIEDGMMEQDLLCGEVFGREDGQWESENPPQNAFDKDTQTAYDGQNGSYAGIKLSGLFYLDGVRYVARDGYEDRINAVQIQGSTDGDTWKTLSQITTVYDNPVYNSVTWEDSHSLGAYSYYRVYSGESEYCNVAEVEFYGHAKQAEDALANILKAAEQMIREDYEAEGVNRVEKAVEAAKTLTEDAAEEEIVEAKNRVSEAVRSLKKPFLLYNFDTSSQRDGDWRRWEDDGQYSGAEWYTEEAGSTFSFQFEGTGFEMISNKNPGLSSIQIVVDGQVLSGGDEVSLYDSYEAGLQKQKIFQTTGLEYGTHAVSVTLLDKQNQEGKGPKASIDAFRIFRDYEWEEEPEIPEPDAPQNIDITALNLALVMAEKMETDQLETGHYTEESWKTVQIALDAARAVLENSDAVQEDADTAFLNLITACNMLADNVQKTGLNAVIKGVRAILQDTESLLQYTKESVDAVRSVLAEAENVFANEAAGQEEVNTVSRNLMDTVTKLLVKEVDTRLDILIKKAEELLKKEEEYTPSSIQSLKAALEEAKIVRDNGQADQEELDKAYNDLAKSMTELVRKANKEELKNALHIAEEILVNQDKYVESSIRELDAMTKEAQAVYENGEADANIIGETLKKLIREILKARLLGDVNLNGVVDTQDVVELLKYSAEIKELTEEQIQAGDVNRDSISDSRDATVILQYAAEMGVTP
ncbi:MAG: glycoside hydrolase N-terminal domain-containing protein [Lachnospiraceae bacterium]|nr:glycoside hydrolase N-terminal domain-containing protein [Lachnospiraceae bacterium]